MESTTQTTLKSLFREFALGRSSVGGSGPPSSEAALESDRYRDNRERIFGGDRGGSASGGLGSTRNQSQGGGPSFSSNPVRSNSRDRTKVSSAQYRARGSGKCVYPPSTNSLAKIPPENVAITENKIFCRACSKFSAGWSETDPSFQSLKRCGAVARFKNREAGRQEAAENRAGGREVSDEKEDRGFGRAGKG